MTPTPITDDVSNSAGPPDDTPRVMGFGRPKPIGQIGDEYIPGSSPAVPPPDYPSTPLDRALGAAVRIGVDLKILAELLPEGICLPSQWVEVANAQRLVKSLANVLRSELAGEGGPEQTSAPVLKWTNASEDEGGVWLALSEIGEGLYWELIYESRSERWYVNESVLTGRLDRVARWADADTGKRWCESRELELRAKRDAERGPVLEWHYDAENKQWHAQSEIMEIGTSDDWLIWYLDYVVVGERAYWSCVETSWILTEILGGKKPEWAEIDAAKAWCESRELELRAKRDAERGRT